MNTIVCLFACLFFVCLLGVGALKCPVNRMWLYDDQKMLQMLLLFF